MNNKDVIIACDFASAEETYRFLDKMGDVKPYVKIGMELYYAEGPAIVHELKRRGHKIFLDLKLHDIPTTMKSEPISRAFSGVVMRTWSPTTPSAKRIPGVTVTKSVPHAAFTIPASSGEQTTPSRPAV